MQIDDKLVDGLTQIGLQRYQAQVYIASFVLGEATAYLIAKESGVPRAKVYSVLDSLVELGFMVKVPAEKGMLFRALPPVNTIDNTINSIISTIDGVKKGITRLQEKSSQKSSESPVMIFNNLSSVISIIEENDFPEAWIDNDLEIASELRNILSKKKSKVHTIASDEPLAFILGETEALFIKGTNGSQTMIRFSDRLLQELIDLTKKLPALEERAKSDTGVRIVGETSIIDLEDRIKTVIPGFDWKTEKILFWGNVEKVTGAFDCRIPCDCFITESRILFGSDDGKVWARAIKFVQNVAFKKGSVKLTFSRVDGTENIAITSNFYANIIANLVAYVFKNSK